MAAFEKFDPPVPPCVQRYVLAQFGIAIAVTLGIAVLFAVAGANAVLLPCVLLWALLYTLGLLNEGRPYAMRLELARLLIIVPAGMLGIALTGHLAASPYWLWAGTGVYLAASVTGLYGATRSSKNISIKQKHIVSN